jgi:hypothetical protein
MATLGSRLRQALVMAALLLLGACARESQDQMSWARAALERNSALEIVAADEKTHTFTVRMKDNGEVRLVRADQVVAGTEGEALPAPAAAAAPTDTHEVSDASATATEATSPAPAAPPAAPTEVAAAAAAVPAGAHVLESGPGYSIEAASPARPALSQSGPGYSIKPAAPGPTSPVRSRARDAAVTSAAVERRREPIVCQGARLLHIDNRNLEFDGDAVSAEDGCEIHITNSHITATGVGVLVRNANVHIDNSLIEGDGGSIDASDGGQVYASDSRFRGLSRRLDTAAFHDLGGNIWN